MRKTLLAATILTLAAAPAFAQTAPSSADKPAASGQGEKSEKMSPGTTGAMKEPSSGVATSPDQVEKQGGMATAPGAQGKAGTEPSGDSKMDKPK